MNHRVRGAATVSVMWLIFLLVLLVAAGFFVYVLASERATKEAEVAEAKRREKGATERQAQLSDRLRLVSDHVGFLDRDSTEPFSRPEEIRGQIEALKTNYEYIGPDVTTMDRMVDALVAQNESYAVQIAELRQQVAAAEESRGASEDAMRTMESTKDTEIEDWKSKLDDERARAANAESTLQDSLGKMTTQLDEARAAERAARAEAESQIEAMQSEMRVIEGRVHELAKKLEIHRNPEEPDGEVLAVSNVGTVSIDLGRKDLLRRGTRFRAFRYGKGGEILPKGLIEVRKVGEEQSEAGVVELYDELDPIAPGDRISAPLYDPEQQREFVLIGRFPAGYSKESVAERLRSLGAAVASQVGPSTDFLVVGGEEVPEDPEAESGDPTDTEAYRLAQVFKVQTLPAKEILDFLRYD